MAVTTESPAPYAPASAILEIIDRFRNRGLSTPFSSDVLARAGVSDSLIPRTLQALTTLELIDENQMPTETLENLRRAPEPELQDRLAGWLKNVYADVLSFVEPNDDESALRDAFRAYNPVGQQPRMVSLFTALCRAAGLREEDRASSTPRPRVSMSARATPKASTRKQTSRTRSASPRADSLPPSTHGMPPALMGLMRSLPESGTWTMGERDKFVSTFEAVLDFCYQVVENPKEEPDDD